MKRDPVILMMVAMVVSLLLVFALNENRKAPAPEILNASKMAGQIAHEFALSTTDGRTIRLSDLRGQAVVLNFWSTTCGPCKIEMPWFVQLQKEYGPKGLQILGVAFEPTDVQDITEFSTDMGVDYPILVAGQTQRQQVANDYGGVSYLPETLYIGRDGKVVEKIIGLNSREEIEESIQRALAQGAAKGADGQSAALQRLGASSAALVKANSQ